MTRLEPTAAPLLRMEGVSKRYGGVRALDNADLVVDAGRIHAILGENGAGKSTLIKIIAGVVAPDAGRIAPRRGGKSLSTSPAAANRAGHRLHLPGAVARSRPFGRRQHRASPIRRGASDMIDRPRAAAPRGGSARARRRARTSIRWRWSRTCRCHAGRWSRSPRRWRASPASSFSTRRPRRLTAADVAKVFVVSKRLREEGLALLFISHRMHEIAELADECTVFRNGANVATYAAGTKTDNEVVEMMIGREYSHVFPPKPAARANGAAPLLEVRNLSWTDRLRDISFTCASGRGRRPRRSRRAGPAGIAAGAFRRACAACRAKSASPARRCRHRARMRRRRSRSAWRSSRRTAKPKA